MNNKTLTIAVLSIIATILLVANFITVQPADASVSIKDRDYQLATAQSVKGGDILYVIDARTGVVAALIWDNQARALRPVASEQLTTLFK